LPIGTAKPLALLENHADRADMRRLVGQGKIGVGQPPGLGIDDQVLGDAAPGERKDALAIDVAAGAHAQLAENAAIEVEQHLRVRSIERPVWIELVEMRRLSISSS
jgi:hypothetical protein